MIHTYTVTGMTCNGCKASVEKAISNIEYVEKTEVNLEKQTVVFHSEKILTTDYINTILPEKFNVVEGSITTFSSTEKTKSELQQLKPLFIIFGYITMSSLLMQYKHWDSSRFMLDFMGLFYVVFSFFKFLDLKGFSQSFKMYDPLAKTIPFYGKIYPFLELILCVLFLMRIQIPLALMVTIIVLGITTIGVTKVLLDKKRIQCACLGTALKLPMTKATFIENTIMIIMAIIMLIITNI